LILAKGRVQFVVNGPLPPHTVEASLRATLDKQLSQINAPGLHGAPAYDVQFVRADSALSALDALASALDGAAANKGAAIAAFQRDFVASNASPLSGALAAALPADHQAATAGATAHLALAYVEGVVAADRAVLSQARTVVNGLERAASEGAGKAHRLSLVARGVEGGVVEGSVEQSVAASKADIQHLFSSRFSWLGLLARLRVDDVGAELGAYLSRSFARDMETQLVFEAGELAQLQSYLGDRSRETARNLSTKAKPSVPGAGAKATAEVGHPFCSPVLLNHLDSLALSVPPVTARTLLAPVTARRTQLLTTAVPRLQVGAQRALLASAGLGLASAAGAWTLAVPPLQLISGNTAFATALLGIVGALALGQNLGARAQRRWWRDWNRVTDMLKEDLAANYDASVDTLVLARPRAAADGLSELVDRRAHRLDELERSVDALHARVVREQHEHEHEHTNGSS
jgi:hypothetical protein